MSDLEGQFRSLSLKHYEVAADQSHGAEGVDALIRLLETARELLKHVAYEMLTEGLRVVVAVDPQQSVHAEGGATYRRLGDLSGIALSALTVAIVSPSEHRVWPTLSVNLVCDGPVFTYTYIHGQSETITIDGVSWPVNDSPWACGMATPTFATLEDALARYISLNRVPEQCAHLDKVWRDRNRLGLVDKPEKHMRRSLELALMYSLREATVRPEQNQSETKPVDIEVTWWKVKRSAIIEIKWLGHSGPPAPNEFTTKYGSSRAISGLRQLAEYLDLRDRTTSDVPVVGYLFVFDARRRNLDSSQTVISREDGLYYRMTDPDYPANLLDRPDMGQPYRCFLEPICA